VRAQQRTKDALFCALARMSAPAQRIRQRGSRRGVVKKTQAPWRGLARITRPAAPLTTGPPYFSGSMGVVRNQRYTPPQGRRVSSCSACAQSGICANCLTHKPFAHRRGDVIPLLGSHPGGGIALANRAKENLGHMRRGCTRTLSWRWGRRITKALQPWLGEVGVRRRTRPV